MVHTRSQTRLIAAIAANKVAVERVTKVPVQKQPITYQGFVISSLKYKEEVCGFLGDELYLGIHGMLKHDCPLEAFWQFPSLTVDRDIIKTSMNALPLEERISRFTQMMNDEKSWTDFDNTIEHHIESKKDLVFSPEEEANLRTGVDIWSGVDLSPLRFFYIWVNQLNELFVSINHELANRTHNADSRIKKAKIVTEIWRLFIISQRFLKNRYIHSYSYNSLFYTIVKKMLEFINCSGSESSLYVFAAYYPNMVCGDIHPEVNKENEIYNHPELTISEDDPVFGPLKKTYGKFYTL